MAVNIPIMAANIAEPSELATAMIGRPWHPTKHVALLLGVKYSVPGLLELLGKWNDDANYPQDTQVCNLKRLHATFRVAHYLLTRLFPIPNSGQSPFKLNDGEPEGFARVGSKTFQEFTRMLKFVENHTFVGPVPVGEETLEGLFVKKLEGSQLMEDLRQKVDEKFNLLAAKRLKELMDEEARGKLLQDLQGIEGAHPDLLA